MGVLLLVAIHESWDLGLGVEEGVKLPCWATVKGEYLHQKGATHSKRRAALLWGTLLTLPALTTGISKMLDPAQEKLLSLPAMKISEI